MKLEDLVVYQLAMEIGDDIYFQIEKWDSFAKWTTGKQLLEAAEISEDAYNEFIVRLDELRKRHNNYIKSIGFTPKDQLMTNDQ